MPHGPASSSKPQPRRQTALTRCEHRCESHLLPTELPRLLLLLLPLGLLRLRLLVAEADLVGAWGGPAGRQHAERVPEQALHLLAVRRQGLQHGTARHMVIHWSQLWKTCPSPVDCIIVRCRSCSHTPLGAEGLGAWRGLVRLRVQKRRTAARIPAPPACCGTAAGACCWSPVRPAGLPLPVPAAPGKTSRMSRKPTYALETSRHPRGTCKRDNF